MGDFNLDAATRPTITIKTRSDDDTAQEHHFEVLPLTKQRFEVVRKAAARLAELEGSTTDEALAEVEALSSQIVDTLVRSKDGPETISSLYEDGLLGRAHLVRLGEYVQQEAFGDPPA